MYLQRQGVSESCQHSKRTYQGNQGKYHLPGRTGVPCSVRGSARPCLKAWMAASEFAFDEGPEFLKPQK